ncbi:4738_t:CDS:2, partial [Scutellospora calospora]
MVSESPEESFFDFSMKYLDAVFGANDTSELPRIKIDDLSTLKETQGSTITTSGTRDDLRTEQIKDQSNSTIQRENIKNGKKITSASVTSIQTKSSTNISDTNTNIASDSSDSSSGKQFPGLIDATLKRKSIIGLEDDSTCYTLNSEPITEELHIETNNPSHLFWVPAHLHPEIAPNEFRKWLNHHAKDRFNTGVGSLRRRKSALSRQYIPTENDEDEKSEKKMEFDKNRDWSSLVTSAENIVPTKVKTIRRSLSLNLSPFIGSNTDPKDPNIFDRHSSAIVESPVLIPRMAPALKRAARTKIRRNSVAGEQNPRRFSAHRRTKSTHVPSDKDKQNGNLLPIIPKSQPESLLSNALTLPQNERFDTSDDKALSTPDIVIEPEEVENDIVLDFIELNDDSGPIRITLKDDGPTPVAAAVPSPRRTSSLPQNAINQSDSLQGYVSSSNLKTPT